MKREDPPAQTRGSRSGSNHYADESAEARENPGTWFLLKTYDKATDKDKASGYGLATNIRAGKIAAFRPGGAFDSRGAVGDDGSMKVYLLYFGKAVEDELVSKAKAAKAKAIKAAKS
jgi:hypothetical protein